MCDLFEDHYKEFVLHSAEMLKTLE